VVEFYLKLKLILRLITYLAYICWEIDNFVIKSDIFRRFFICKNILKKLSCYHDDNYFRYFMFGKYNGIVSKSKVSACMYFLVFYHVLFTCAKYFAFCRSRIFVSWDIVVDCERSLLSAGLDFRACERKGGTADNTSRNEIRVAHTTQNSHEFG
jgi:hypothetical protein